MVYAITCACPKVYVGQTTQEIRKRIQRHLSDISLAKRDASQGKNLTSVASHFLQHHHGKPQGLQVPLQESSIKVHIPMQLWHQLKLHHSSTTCGNIGWTTVYNLWQHWLDNPLQSVATLVGQHFINLNATYPRHTRRNICYLRKGRNTSGHRV